MTNSVPGLHPLRLGLWHRLEMTVVLPSKGSQVGYE